MFRPISEFPSKPGSYEIDVEGIMFCFAQFLNFDGERWETIPKYWANRKIFWYDYNMSGED